MGSIIQKLNSFLVQSKRVYQVTKKPNKHEFKMIVKVTGLGAAIIGVIGFIITIAGQFII
ncbi:MAG: protein translocase SEC61 complex subunit gamma [Nanoarchaeota archaeon]